VTVRVRVRLGSSPQQPLTIDGMNLSRVWVSVRIGVGFGMPIQSECLYRNK